MYDVCILTSRNLLEKCSKHEPCNEVRQANTTPLPHWLKLNYTITTENTNTSKNYTMHQSCSTVLLVSKHHVSESYLYACIKETCSQLSFRNYVFQTTSSQPTMIQLLSNYIIKCSQIEWLCIRRISITNWPWSDCCQTIPLNVHKHNDFVTIKSKSRHFLSKSFFLFCKMQIL